MSAVGAGDQQQVNSVSTENFTTALVTNVVICAIQVGVFLAVFRVFPNIYEPRSYLPAKLRDRSTRLPRLPWQTLLHIFQSPKEVILQQNGLDAYMFIELLRMLIKFFFVTWIISWIVLLPVNSANSGGSGEGLERFTFGNVGPENQARLWAHLCLAWAFTIWAFYLISKYMAKFVTLRHQFLTSEARSQLAQAKTVLITGIPTEFRHRRALHKAADLMPGDGAEHIWLSKDLGAMYDLYDRQVQASAKLEGAETTFFKNASKYNSKSQQKLEKLRKKNKSGKLSEEALRDKAGVKTFDAEKQESVVAAFSEHKGLRPTHKIESSWLPFSGKKVDTIDWCKEELVTVIKSLEEERATLLSRPAGSAAFIQFHNQIAAHIFSQSTLHHRPLQMANRYADVAPDDVLFGNLDVNPLEQRLRYVVSWGATIGLIIAWVFPVAFVGLLSNVNELCSQVPWLAWLCDLPVPINGIIQGLLPPVALALLFLVLPIILRQLAKFEGIPLRSQVELSLMTRYFCFLVVHGFVTVTLSSGLIAAIPNIVEDPSSAVSDLARNLPRASNFFLSYMVTHSLSGASGNFLQILTLIIYYILFFIIATTPRRMSSRQFRMPNTNWGTVYPNITLLAVIGIAYSIISPLMNGFAFLAFCLFYFCYKYLFTFVYNMPKAGETGGRFFPKAVTHLFVGIYIEEICLCALFFLARDAQGDVSALPQAILMIILGVLTILFHVYLTSSYSPLIRNLPLDLALELSDEDREGDVVTSAERKQIQRIKQALDPLAKVKGVGEASVAKIRGAGDAVFRNPKINGEAYAMQNLNQSDANPTRNEAEEEGLIVSDRAFEHPAGWQQVKPIWLPADQLGLAESEVASIRALGLESTTYGAVMNEKGQTRIHRPAPEVFWEADAHGYKSSSPADEDSRASEGAVGARDLQVMEARESNEPPSRAPEGSVLSESMEAPAQSESRSSQERLQQTS